jgi:hypothetical protein
LDILGTGEDVVDDGDLIDADTEEEDLDPIYDEANKIPVDPSTKPSISTIHPVCPEESCPFLNIPLTQKLIPLIEENAKDHLKISSLYFTSAVNENT